MGVNCHVAMVHGHYHVTGFKTCAITNNWIDDSRGQPDHLHKYLGRYFDAVLESCKLGVRKPDVRIYQMACERLGVHPSEVSKPPSSQPHPSFSILYCDKKMEGSRLPYHTCSSIVNP